MEIDADHFFFYGQVDLRKEIESDLFQGLLQDPGTLFYARSFGAGVAGLENMPVGALFGELAKYRIAAWLARRNQEVSNGSGGSIDRRAVTSQTAIEVLIDGDSVEVDVTYVPLFDYESPGTLALPLSV